MVRCRYSPLCGVGYHFIASDPFPEASDVSYTAGSSFVVLPSPIDQVSGFRFMPLNSETLQDVIIACGSNSRSAHTTLTR